MTPDEKYMRLALNLARKGTGITSPNPMVGAVIVKDGWIIGKGYHKGPGKLHAEAEALQNVSIDPNGATLYVNLEPCCHTDKRTPPCTKEIIKSKIRRVVIGMNDPNPLVNGRGVRELADAGIEIENGVLQRDASMLNEMYSKFITTNIPYVIMKAATSLDGKIALASGESRWITGKVARRYSHRLRAMVDAVMVGIGTILTDDPSLNVRHIDSKGKQPLRIILDSKLRIPVTAKVLQVNYHETGVSKRKTKIPPLLRGESSSGSQWPTAIPPFVQGGAWGGDSRMNSEQATMVVTTKAAPLDKIEALEKNGIKVMIVEEREDGEVGLKSLIPILGKSGITSILIEGGSSVNASALREGIVDKVVMMYSPRIIGGSDSVNVVGGSSPKSLDDSIFFKNIKIRRLGEDIMVIGYR
ncbi:MAG: bifunctional diaminohydroxyphosphoribosylaminopyrimidine deaminase/5-amino-6-(5-phosphoribosylamino)uracil reductase RibD [Nitrospirae bacterium]|nr:bifunctional diaminohydroxyphosphoribosylaminopyrimidine deaminase/5-amino-6-(5-phosphoribosylamino)uracil reductase RibD [Nitrospirota bacterium]